MEFYKTKNIPSFISDFILSNNFNIKELIQDNERKGTYVFKVSRNDKFYILKFCQNNSPKKIRDKFVKEIDFYNISNGESVAKIIHQEENVLVLEYIDGITLREAIIKNKVNTDLIDDLFIKIEQLYENGKRYSDNYNFDNAFSRLEVLISSGPIQTINVKIPLIKKILNKFLSFYLRNKLKKVIFKAPTLSLREGFVQGDFHYNNILIEDNKVKFIDFENVQYNGFFEFDILFLLVMIETLLEDSNEKKYFQERIKNFLGTNHNLEEIYEIYKKAIKFNNRFHMRNL